MKNAYVFKNILDNSICIFSALISLFTCGKWIKVHVPCYSESDNSNSYKQKYSGECNSRRMFSGLYSNFSRM